MVNVFKKVNYHIKKIQMLLVDLSFLFVVLSFHYHFVGTPDINSKGNNKNALLAPINVISSPWGIHNRHPRTKSSTVKVIEVSDFFLFLEVFHSQSPLIVVGPPFSQGLPFDCISIILGKTNTPTKNYVAVGGRFNFSICGVCLSSKCFTPQRSERPIIIGPL